ncbi:xanthine dehydrogenase family protein molybdopterin-binding subunit [Mesoterricola silvestris]|uniref:Aldehyde oxidase n=1 Tax=Mesoterricola silvestris TaxID=2927979 RepID=A0AA48K9I9_9BACT|nr:xanthine dehydrogenase family protein molybdopterin-binding subunit [Mesoterricola silvestris]BDU74044.1 aldehyde oxidase [Mesoterricola silvestris]
MIGASTIRKEGRGKVMGSARYTDDVELPGCLVGVTVRSRCARGILRGITFGEGVPWDAITVVTAADIPGKNFVAGHVDDQPFLVPLGGTIAHAEQPVLLLAHADRAVAEKARRLVRLEVEELPPLLDIEEALACVRVIHGERNILKEIRIAKGDPDPVWAGAAHVVEGEYRTGAQEQLYLEPNAMIGTVERGAEGLEVTVSGSLQCPYYVHEALRHLFGIPGERVRVVALEMGGAFGGKEDYPSVIAGHAALLALKSGRPVRIAYDREEDMAATTKRHPSRTRIRSAFDGEGRLLALDIDFALDGGAFTTLSPVVLSRGALHAAGVYACPAVRILARAVATNTPPCGAFRGFGAPQSLFAIERHMDVAARRMGMDPVDLRRINFLREGDTMATGQVMREDPGLEGLMDRAMGEIHYRDLQKAYAVRNAWDDPVKRGVGLSVFMHGCGFTGSGEATMASVAGVEGLEDGSVAVLAASTEMGQGKNTVFCQIVAETLGLPVDMVDMAEVDTKFVPNSGPTVASRSTMVVGRILEDAARGLRLALVQGGFLAEPYGPGEFREAVRKARRSLGSLKAYGQYQANPGFAWDDKNYRGDAYPNFSWACYAAAVAVDLATFEVKVEDFATVQEVGRVVNPTLATGQIQGGVAQGIGWGLWEEVTFREGRMANNQLTNYIIPTSADLPHIRVAFLEGGSPFGPGGAKGIGELPMDGPAPALLNALRDALGDLRLDEVPMTPERILNRLEEARHA